MDAGFQLARALLSSGRRHTKSGSFHRQLAVWCVWQRVLGAPCPPPPVNSHSSCGQCFAFTTPAACWYNSMIIMVHTMHAATGTAQNPTRCTMVTELQVRHRHACSWCEESCLVAIFPGYRWYSCVVPVVKKPQSWPVVAAVRVGPSSYARDRSVVPTVHRHSKVQQLTWLLGNRMGTSKLQEKPRKSTQEKTDFWPEFGQQKIPEGCVVLWCTRELSIV